MYNPRHYLYFMIVYLAAVAVVCALLYAPLKAAFMANWGFNLLILSVLAIGIGINIHQVLRLSPELQWMQMFRTGQAGASMAEEGTVVLRPLRKHLSGVHRDRFRMSAPSMTTVLDGIRAHLDESREISRYMIALLIFLGLLGTFWGLLGTIGAVGNVIGGLDPGSRDFAMIFGRLREGLLEPLRGMGTAFSTSLFGLGGSLILGFIDIQAGHAQNRFFNEMEEWLLGATQLIDHEEESQLQAARGTSRMARIERSLEILIEEIRNDRQTREKVITAAGKPENEDD